jgi:high-affinity iron transporter
MLATLIIVFREIIEAGLIIGIVLAATRNVPNRGAWVCYGVVGGIIGACIIAVFAGKIGEAMAGTGQEFFNAAILFTAVFMLAWHNVWMARHGRSIATELKAVGESVSTGKKSVLALAIVVGTAVLREGAEIVLFLYGIIISGKETIPAMALGGLVGVLIGGCISALMYLGLLKIPTRYIFSATSALITLLAAGMAAQATSFLQQGGFVDLLTETVWDTSHILSENSIFGKLLHTLIGYTDQPNGLQIAAYFITIITIFILMKFFSSAPKKVAA